MGVIIAITNNKGGIGKTTSTLNLSTALARMGKKTLMIDLDPQSSLSVNYGLEPLEKFNSIYNVLVDELEADEIVCELEENLYLIPSSIELSKAELTLIGKISRETVLKKKLEKLKNEFDYILIDNSPSLGILTINSLACADYVISPTDATYFSLRGLEILMEVISQIKEINPKLEFMATLITMVDSRVGHHRQVITELEKRYPTFEQLVKRSIKFSDAGLTMSSIFDYAGNAFEGAKAYNQIAKEVIEYGKEA